MNIKSSRRFWKKCKLRFVLITIIHQHWLPGNELSFLFDMFDSDLDVALSIESSESSLSIMNWLLVDVLEELSFILVLLTKDGRFWSKFSPFLFRMDVVDAMDIEHVCDFANWDFENELSFEDREFFSQICW